MSKETVYITGHKNPDSDSICAAIAYADLKNRRGKVEAIPIRQGELNRETQFILDYFGVDVPILKTTMKPQISDIQYDLPYKISGETTMNKALSIIQNESNSSLQVVNENEELIGIVSLSNLTEGYMDIWDDNVLARSNTTIENVVEVLRGEIIYISENPRPLSGRMTVYAMSPENVEDMITENDIVIVGNRDDAIRDAIEKGVSVLILTVGTELSEQNLHLAKENNVTILTTELDTFLAARLLPLSVPVNYVMTKENLVSFQSDEYIDDIKTIMTNTRYRSYPILDERNKVIGSIARYHLISNKKKSLILVDHNERNQSVSDIEYAEIDEIIDHHRVANVSTTQPVFFRNEPVGSTSTIIAGMFFESGMSPSREIAGILAAAIISDTLLLRSPTSTDEDRRILERVSKIADINPEEFAEKMFKAGTSLEGKKPSDLLHEDMKEFNIEGEKIRIAQVFTMDLDSLENMLEDLKEQTKAEMIKDGIVTYVVVFTDILKEMSEILVIGEFGNEIANSFGQKLSNDSFSAPGILSRKKQVVPKITEAIESIKEQ